MKSTRDIFMTKCYKMLTDVLNHIQGIGAAILRNHVVDIQNEEHTESQPSLIVVPNDAFVEQWKSALIASGVSPSKVLPFVRGQEFQLQDTFVIMTRFSLMSEMRHVLKDEGSVLFPDLPCSLVDFLREKRSDATQIDSVTLMLGRYSSSVTVGMRFRTLIIDECHSLRNLVTYGE